MYIELFHAVTIRKINFSSWYKINRKESSPMPQRNTRDVSFDTMIKLFMRQFDLPTKKDFERLVARLDRLETFMRQAAVGANGRKALNGDKLPQTATDVVLEVIKGTPAGATIKDIHDKTGYGDKTLRNIIYRLHKLKAIERVRRGVYRVNK